MTRIIERRHIFGHAEKRYFSDGLALGSQAFLEPIFHRYRGHFGQKRQSGARPMRYGLPRRSSATGPEPDFSKQETGLAGVSRVICFPSGPGSKALESIGASYAPGVVWFRAAIFHWRGPTHASGTPPG
jgi:hypothetical protein